MEQVAKQVQRYPTENLDMHIILALLNSLPLVGASFYLSCSFLLYSTIAKPKVWQYLSVLTTVIKPLVTFVEQGGFSRSKS